MDTTSNGALLSRDGLMRAPSAQVRAWLQQAFASYSDGKGNAAFDPFAEFIGRGDFLADDLHLIYRSVPIEHQGAWRKAIADLVAQLPATQENAQAFDTLIDLARFIPAHEVLDRAGSRLRSEEVANLRLSPDRTLFVRVLKMAMELAAETPEWRDFLLALLHSGSFNRKYSLLMLAALARSDPKNWPDHLASLRGYIAEMLIEDRPSARGLKRHAEALVEAVGFDRVVNQIPKLLRSGPADSAAARARSDDWLLDALLRGANPSVCPVGVPRENGAEVFWAARPEVKVVLGAAILEATLGGPSPTLPINRMTGATTLFRRGVAGFSGLFSRNPKASHITTALQERGLLVRTADA